MTSPLTPVDCDLQDFPFMPLHVARLRDSDLAAEAHPEACWYAVLLWSASWHQLPAASLPDNETVLARLCGLGRDIKTFRRHREEAMRGFVKCTDGRLYHPVVAEQAMGAWVGKIQQRWRTECARIKKQNQRNSTDLPFPTFEEFFAGTSFPRAEHVPEDTSNCPEGQGIQEKETGTETERLYSEDKSSGGQAAEPDFDKLAWDEAVSLLGGGQSARALFGKLLSTNGLMARELLPAITAAKVNQTQDPKGYLTKTAASIARRRLDAAPKRQAFV